MKLTIEGELPTDPRKRTLTIAQVAKAMCQSVGEDPADAIMALLTAAAHIAMRHSDKPPSEIGLILAENLVQAIIAADAWFSGGQPTETRQ